MDYNPWNVDSIQEFYFLNCPECPFLAKDESYFQDHALKKHPLSFVLFGKFSDNEDFDNNTNLEDEDVKPMVDDNLNNEHDKDDSKPNPEEFLRIKEEDQLDDLGEDMDADFNNDDYDDDDKDPDYPEPKDEPKDEKDNEPENDLGGL